MSASQHQLHHLYPEDLQHGDHQSHDCQPEGVEVPSSSADFCPKKLSRIKHQEGCQRDMVVILEETISDTPAGLWKFTPPCLQQDLGQQKGKKQMDMVIRGQTIIQKLRQQEPLAFGKHFCDLA